MISKTDISIHQWLDNLVARGAYGFSKYDLQVELPGYSDVAVKRALNRLSRKGKVVSLYKGYYLIIPPQYYAQGILPPYLFLDAFMKYLKRSYYVGLLNAAALHGSSHQKPQEYFVMTSFPVMRPIQKRGLKINFISIGSIRDSHIEKRKTESGYMNVSNPVLTACDLIQFEKRVGGLNRVGSVLADMAEMINRDHFSGSLINRVPVSILQRLGYLLETLCANKKLADTLFEVMKRERLSLFRIPLKAAKPTKGYSSNNRWRVIVNTKIEIDD